MVNLIEQFSKQRRTITPSISGQPNLIEQFAQNKTLNFNLSPVSVASKTEEGKKKLTKWQWVGKQLMKPVGVVASETEALGKFIGTGRAYIPGKAGLEVLSGKRETSFSDVWEKNAAGFGLSGSTARKIGFVFDLIDDPFQWIGGGLTKLGKLAAKVSSLKKAGKAVTVTERGALKKFFMGEDLATQIKKSGYTAEQLVLAGTKAEQAAKGQRALITALGKPIIGGSRVYKATQRLKEIAGASKIGEIARRTFSTKTGVKELDELVENFNNLSSYRKQEVITQAGKIERQIKKMSPEEVRMVAEVVENPAIKTTIEPIEPLAQEARKLYHGTTIKSAEAIKKSGFKLGGKTNLNKDFIGIDKELLGDVVWFTDTPQRAKVFAGQSGRLGFKGEAGIVEITEQNLKLAKLSDVKGGTLQADNAKLFKAKIDNLKARGFDGLQKSRAETVVWNTEKITQATKRVAPKIENQVIKVADQLENLFTQMKTTEKGKGVLKSELENYFPHIKAEQSLTDRIKYFFNPKKYSTALGAAKGRTIEGTVAEINQRFGREFFQSNPALSYAQRGLASAKAVTAKEFLDEAGKKFFMNAEDAPMGFIESTNPLYKGLKAEPEVVRAIDQYIQGIQPEELKLMAKVFDSAQGWWKAQVLISPSYHLRNTVSNFWSNWLAGVKNPVVYKKAIQVVNGKKANQIILTTDAGEKLTRGAILKSAKERDVIGKGWYGADIAEALTDEIGGRWRGIVGKDMWKPWSQKFALIKTNRAVGSAIEDNARLAHYIDKLQKGFSPDDAARSVKKFLFDYEDLTKIEKSTFKRLLPFYTWTRKNIPLQIENLILQPEKFAAVPKVIQQIEAGVAEPDTEKYMSEYITENVPVRIRTNEEGHTEYFLLGNWLPVASAIDVLSNPIDTLINMTTPILKTPYEVWANKSTFFKNTLGEQSDIEYYYKQPVEFMGITIRKRDASLMRNIRILGDLNKLVQTPAADEPENSWVVKFANVLMGRAATYDIGKSQYFYQRDTQERVNEIKAAIKKAQKLGDEKQVQKLADELNEFQRERSQ